MIELIEDRNAWVAVVESAKEADFYHTYDYHHFSKTAEEHPILIKYQKGDTMIALPLLIRDIEGTDYRDATSVYGYAGPFTRGLQANFDNTHFIRELNDFFQQKKIVSVFSRLNPFIRHQKKILSGMGETSSPGKVVYIDLRETPEQQLGSYHRRLRTYINKSRQIYTIKTASCKDEIRQFISMYYENMERVNARDHYFFKEAYFFDLLGSREFDAEILLAMDAGSEIVGGAMFLKNKRIVQYHLSGARENVMNLNPIKLLIDEMRIRGTEAGYYYFNLGGGVGNNEDSLFQFKAGFSKETRSFELWKFVANKKIYNELVLVQSACKGGNVLVDCGGFFPVYRCEYLR